MIHLKVLLIDNNSDKAAELVEQLQPELDSERCVFINSFHKALEALVQDSYNIIFIADHFPQDKLEHFLKDIKGLKENKGMALVGVVDAVKNQDSKPAPKKKLPSIFDLTINRDLTALEKRQVRAFIEQQTELLRERERMAEVDGVVNHILSQLDEAALSRKRGANTQIISVHRDYIASYALTNTKILENYFEKLTEQSEKQQPTELPALNIDEKVLRRRPPKLTEDGYSGVSARVWKKLSNKSNTHDNEKTALTEAIPPEQEQQTTEQPDALTETAQIEEEKVGQDSQIEDSSSPEETVLPSQPDADET